jgi:DHA2 family multidrug resistance protein
MPPPWRASDPPAAANRASVTTWIAVLAAMIGSFMAILNIQITNASLLNIEGGIGTGVDNGSWISTSYLIGEIVVIPLTDFLSRVFSFRRYMIASAALFAAFSVACAFTHDLPSMIAMRGLQGFAGGVLIPMAFTLVLTKLPKPQQPVGLAIFALSVTFAPAIGPTIGGYLTENYGWQTIFFVNVIPTAIMVGALYLTLERAPMQLKLLKEGDWTGILTMAIGLSALQTVLEEGNKDDWFASPFIQRLAVTGAGADAADLAHDRRHRAAGCRGGIRHQQHAAQPRRRDRHRGARDRHHQARAIPFQHHRPVGHARPRGSAQPDRANHRLFP